MPELTIAPQLLVLLMALVFVVAAAYASVGHGGASGYLAVLSFFGFAPAVMAPGALLLNLVVAGMSFLSYWRAGHFAPRLLWPFLVTSVPFAFLGGLLPVAAHVYIVLLAAVLLFSAYRLVAVRAPVAEESLLRPPRLAVALPVGAAIGLLSGMVGVGGGIFLSPLILLLGWADAKHTAAASAAFIWINSAAGLYGHVSRHTPDWDLLVWLVGAAAAGGALGSWLGARRLTGLWLRRTLGVVLILAAVKLLRSAM